jgi:glycosyltransferase involved in cell wall biosynthesis
MVKLSIVIPYYNTYELTDKLLSALVPQLTDEVEVFLVDDGCHEERLDKYKDAIDIEHLKENVGGASASNIGIRKTSGKYVGFIDSDDMIDDDYIKELIRAIDEHDEDVIFMDWQDMNTGAIVHHPNNYAPWKAIYKKEIMPMYVDGWKYSYDVPFYDELNSKPYTKYYIDKVLYYYNSNRPGNLTTEKAKLIASKGE